MADQVLKFLDDSDARAEFLKSFFEKNAASDGLSDQADALGGIFMEVCEELGFEPITYDDVSAERSEDTSGGKADKLNFDEFTKKYGVYIFRALKNKNGL